MADEPKRYLGNGVGRVEEYNATFRPMRLPHDTPPPTEPRKGVNWHVTPDTVAVPFTARLREGLTRFRLTFPKLSEPQAAAKLIEDRLIQLGDLPPETK